MPRTRRYIKANGLYEITFRARDSLPFPCTRTIESIVYSVLSRVQREQKVILHHLIVEVSHVHLICTARDAYQCQRFYGEVKKQLTDAVKCLLGIRHLNLWERRTNVSEIPTLEDAISKIAYLYTNPSNDGLTQSIEEYPGVNTWKSYQCAPPALDACVSSSFAWIKLPDIQRLPSRSLSARQDSRLLSEMLDLSREKHLFELSPNSWIARFVANASDEEVRHINGRVLSRVRSVEEKNSRLRRTQGKGVVGPLALKNLPMLKTHFSKKQGRRVFVQSKFQAVRLALIQEMRAIEALCREAFKRWAKGDFGVSWPPGTFPPPLPHMASAVQYL